MTSDANPSFASGDTLNLPKCGITCSIASVVLLLGFIAGLTLRCSKIHYRAKRQTSITYANKTYDTVRL